MALVGQGSATLSMKDNGGKECLHGEVGWEVGRCQGQRRLAAARKRQGWRLTEWHMSIGGQNVWGVGGPIWVWGRNVCLNELFRWGIASAGISGGS